jgi:spermidine synthase
VILLAAAGLLSMLAQVVILRELVAALFGVELLYVVALGAWLVGTASGARLGRHVSGSRAAVAVPFLALGALTLADLWFIRAAGVIVGAVPGAYLPFPIQLAGVVAATVPPSFVCGLLFPPLVRRVAPDGLRPSQAYAWECAGAAAGGLVVTAMFWSGLSTLQVALITAAAAAVAALHAAVSRHVPALLGMAGIVALATGLVWGPARSWDVSLLRWQYPALVAVDDTPYARIAVTRSDGQVAVFANGALAFETEGTSAEAFADLAALQHGRPRRALVIGGGTEGVADALMAHGLSAIDNVEVDERADALVRRVIGQGRTSGRSSTTVRVIYDEPRRVLERERAYDLILVAMPPPTSGETSRFYTQEFFAVCRAHLAAWGVLAIRLPAAENFWPPPLARLVGSVVGALAHEFPSVSVVPGGTLYAFGGVQPLPQSAEPLVERLAARALSPRLMTPPYLRYLYGNDRRAAAGWMLRASPESGINRDAAPVAYGYAARLWLSKFYPQLAAAGDERGWGSGPAIAVVLAMMVCGLWWAGRTPARASLAVIAVVSGTAMAIETAALLRYQVANGVMFVNVGWLLTCFMTGMALGSWGGGAPAGRRLLDASPWSLSAVLVAAASGVMFMTRWPQLAGLAATSLLLALTGLAGGAAFAAVTHKRPGEQARAVSSVYAADVAGGAIGAWLAPLVLVPAVGLDGTAALAAASALALVPLLVTSGVVTRAGGPAKPEVRG